MLNSPFLSALHLLIWRLCRCLCQAPPDVREERAQQEDLGRRVLLKAGPSASKDVTHAKAFGRYTHAFSIDPARLEGLPPIQA